MIVSDRVNSWLSFIANVGILAGLVLVAIELNQNTDQLKLQLVFQTTQKLFDNNRDLLGDNPTPAITKSITNPEGLTYEEFLIASSFILNQLNEWEDRFLIHEAGLISDQDWKRHIDENVGWTLGNEFAQRYWRISSSVFEPEFAQYVDKAITSIDEHSTYREWLESGYSSNSEKSKSTQ